MTATFFPAVAGATDCATIIDACNYGPHGLRIDTQPVNKVAIVGDDKTLDVVATSLLGTVTYQWYRRSGTGGTPIALTNTGRFSGVTTDELAIAAAESGDASYYYHCTVDDGLTTLDTDLVRIGILSYTALVDVHGYAGESSVWNPAATCVFAITYTWSYAGVSVGTGATYSRAVSIFDNNETVQVIITSLDRSVTLSATSFVAAQINITFDVIAAVVPVVLVVVDGATAGPETTNLVNPSVSGGYAPLTFAWSTISQSTSATAVANDPTSLQTDFDVTVKLNVSVCRVRLTVFDSRSRVATKDLLVAAAGKPYSDGVPGLTVNHWEYDVDILNTTELFVSGAHPLAFPTITGDAISDPSYFTIYSGHTSGWYAEIYSSSFVKSTRDNHSTVTKDVPLSTTGLTCPQTAVGEYVGFAFFSNAKTAVHGNAPTNYYITRTQSPPIPIKFTVTS